MADTDDEIASLEKLAAWHRMKAAHAGSVTVWEAHLLTAEDLELRAADLRIQRQRNAARRRSRPALV